MAIKISSKRLSTIQGQAGIIQSAKLEETLGNTVEFVGDPSLRILLVDKIDTFPWSDNLFHLQLLVSQHCYSDSSAKDAWVEKHFKRVVSPEVVAVYMNDNTDNHDKLFKEHPWERIEAGLKWFQTYTLDSLLSYALDDDGKKLKHFRLRYISEFLKRMDSSDSSVQDHTTSAIRACITLGHTQWIKAILHMANTRLLHTFSKGDNGDVSSMINDAGDLMKRTIAGLTTSFTLYDPHTFNAVEWLAELDNRNRRD